MFEQQERRSVERLAHSKAESQTEALWPLRISTMKTKERGGGGGGGRERRKDNYNSPD